MTSCTMLCSLVTQEAVAGLLWNSPCRRAIAIVDPSLAHRLQPDRDLSRTRGIPMATIDHTMFNCLLPQERDMWEHRVLQDS